MPTSFPYFPCAIRPDIMFSAVKLPETAAARVARGSECKTFFIPSLSVLCGWQDNWIIAFWHMRHLNWVTICLSSHGCISIIWVGLVVSRWEVIPLFQHFRWPHTAGEGGDAGVITVCNAQLITPELSVLQLTFPPKTYSMCTVQFLMLTVCLWQAALVMLRSLKHSEVASHSLHLDFMCLVKGFPYN